MSDKYEIEGLEVLPFPELRRTGSGEWQREWRLELKQPISERIGVDAIAARHSSNDMMFEFDVGGCLLMMRVISRLHGGADPVMFETGRVVAALEREVGEILSIEGVSRAKWTYFRWK